MKRWVVLLFFAMAGSWLSAAPVVTGLNLFDHFKQDIQKYRIEPSWVLRYFFHMNLQEFESAWSHLCLIIKEKPWFLLYDSPSRYVESQVRPLLIQHCKAYDTFLMSLFVCPETEDLICSLNLVTAKTDLSIFDYWKMKKLSPAADFYAFYFDQVSAQYIEVTKNAFLNMDTSQDYYDCFQQSWDALSLLNTIFMRLVGTSYEARYADHLKKYSELRQLLSKEKAKQDAP